MRPIVLNYKKKADKLVDDMKNNRIGDMFQFPSWAKHDKRLALRILKLDNVDGMKLKWFSEDLQRNVQLLSLALEKQPDMLLGIPKKTQKELSLNVIKNAVKEVTSTKYLQTLDKEILNNKEIAKEILTRFGVYIRFFNDDIKDDKALVTLACQTSPEAFLSASNRLKNDPETVYMAVKAYTENIKFANERFRVDYGFGGDVCEYGNGMVLKHVDDRLKSDPSVIRRAMKNNPLALQYATDDIRRDVRFFKDIFLKHPQQMDRFFKNFLNDDISCLNDFQNWLTKLSIKRQDLLVNMITKMDNAWKSSEELQALGRYPDDALDISKRSLSWLITSLNDENLNSIIVRRVITTTTIIEAINQEKHNRLILHIQKTNGDHNQSSNENKNRKIMKVSR